jgi:rhodanese-related sulfurtransferase
MRKKIIGVVVCIAILITSITVTGITSNKIILDNYDISKDTEDVKMVLYKAPFYFGVNLDIENNGDTTLNDVEWSFRSKAAITGTGIFIKEVLQKGTIDEINPDETVTLNFKPFSLKLRSPIGLGNLYMNASVEADGLSVRTQQRSLLFGFFVLNFRDTYMDIKPKEAYERWQNDEFDLIIDVVGLDIYSLGHLPGAVNYVWADGTLNSKIPDLNTSWTYLVYCHTDPPSTASAQALINAGIKNVYRLEGNYAAWKEAGYPIETD